MNEPELHFEHSTTKVTSVFEAAAEFGLAPEEIWSTVAATLDRLPEDAKTRCVEELSGALASRVIDKQRSLATVPAGEDSA